MVAWQRQQQRHASFALGDGLGVCLLDLAVEKSGAWFAYSGDRLGQGRDSAKTLLKDNPQIRQAIEERVRQELGLIREAEVATVDAVQPSTGAGLDIRSSPASR